MNRNMWKLVLAAMIAGFVSVPFFKFVAPALPLVGSALKALSELPPAFVVSGLAGVIFSLLDPKGTQRLADVDAELTDAARRHSDEQGE